MNARQVPADLVDTIRALELRGYVVLRAKSYRAAQERQRIAEAGQRYEAEGAEHARAWARDVLSEDRRLRERMTYLYGLAARYGATDEELRGDS